MQIKLQNRHALLFALPLVMLLSSCGSKTDADDFFPLQAGKSWTYRVTTELGEGIGSKVESLTLDTRGEQEVVGVKAMRRHSDSGVDYWLRSDDKGIYRVASKNALDAAPKADEVPRYVLRKPYAVDTTWQASTVAYILQRRNELPKEIRYTHKPVMMVYRIDALDQKVSTSAGNFEGCIKVLGRSKNQAVCGCAICMARYSTVQHRVVLPQSWVGAHGAGRDGAVQIFTRRFNVTGPYTLAISAAA